MKEIIEIVKHYLTYNHLISATSLILIVAAMVFLITPRVIFVAHQKNLIIPIISRSSHSKEVPSLGGVTFFITFLLCIPIINIIHFGSFAGYNVIAALSILFMVGLKDDLVNSSPKVKLYGQILASLFIVLSPDFLITNYHGFLGIYNINPMLSMILSMAFLVFFINSYNLIDGLDGLASIIGIVISSTFLMMFTMQGDYFFAALSLVTLTTLITFLRFNLCNGKMKMFMGDCGSLLIGLIIGIMVLRFLASEPLPLDKQIFTPENRFVFVFSILIIPLLDTFRVIGIRIMKGKSPLQADKNHLHHLILQFVKRHFIVSLSLGILNVFIIWLCISIAHIYSVETVVTIMFITILLVLMIFYMMSLNRKHKYNNNFNVESERYTENQLHSKLTSQYDSIS